MSEQTQQGPCISCGATNYPLSFGGPGICPTCDCSPPTMRQLRLEREAYEGQIKALRAELETANARLAMLSEAANVARLHIHAIFDFRAEHAIADEQGKPDGDVLRQLQHALAATAADVAAFVREKRIEGAASMKAHGWAHETGEQHVDRRWPPAKEGGDNVG